MSDINKHITVYQLFCPRLQECYVLFPGGERPLLTTQLYLPNSPPLRVKSDPLIVRYLHKQILLLYLNYRHGEISYTHCQKYTTHNSRKGSKKLGYAVRGITWIWCQRQVAWSN